MPTPRTNAAETDLLKAALQSYLQGFLSDYVAADADTAAILIGEHAFLADADADSREQYLNAKATLLGLQAEQDAAIPPTTVAKNLNGIEVALIPGRTYFATRPMAKSGMRLFPVTISDANGRAVFTTPPLPYDEANRFMAHFTPTVPFGGIIW